MTFARLDNGEIALRPARQGVKPRPSKFAKLRGRATVTMKTEEILALTRAPTRTQELSRFHSSHKKISRYLERVTSSAFSAVEVRCHVEQTRGLTAAAAQPAAQCIPSDIGPAVQRHNSEC